jgi:ABC-type branched-subunit amino acid transport system ATPase component
VTVLEIRGLVKRFGGVVALAGIDVTIKSDEIIGIIGPNGSGKTTLFNAVCGVCRPDAGIVRWEGEDITRRSSFKIGRLGIARTFQQAMSFPALRVCENVEIALEHGFSQSGGSSRRWSSPDEILQFVGLGGFADARANSMPFGNLRRLGVAVALAAHPSQLLLDEPAAGLNEGESAELVHLIRRVHQLGIGVCVIDHHVGMIAEVCRRLIVLHFGNKIADGATDGVLRDAKVIEVYLGS